MTDTPVPARDAGPSSEMIPWIAPFVAFVGMMALEKALPLSPGLLYPVRVVVVLAVMLVFSRRVIPWVPTHAFSSVALGIAVFAIWIAPDLLWPGMRNHWLFHNSLMGSASSSLPGDLKTNPVFIAFRVFGSVGLVPILEELFWRGWMMRWLISQNFGKVLLGTFTPLSFWMTAVLFASEHGSYWEVGLITGILYNWWMIRTRNLPDCILAHAVTNGCLAAYVLAWNQWQYWL
jgi:CAAX protease family protein